MACLKRVIKKTVDQCLRPFHYCTISNSYLQHLVARNQLGDKAIDDLQLIGELPDGHAAQALRLLGRSSSQLRQDLFVLSELQFKTNGYFVEFGATDGVSLSNTHLLEREFGWTGILAEPAKRWHGALKKNRHAHIETDCVWRESGVSVTFNEVDEGELSTIASFSASDHHSQARKAGLPYEVTTISLLDLLAKYHAPQHIDYLSIDTEGSEYEILRNFDFDRYEFQVITCEHNFQPAREEIYSLLTGNGYVRKFDKLSKFDDWYIRAQ